MAKQLAAPGTCCLCKEPITKRTAASHMLKNHSDEPGDERFIILVDTPYASPYWMILIVRPDATLLTLDEVLRDVWVECCGHMSSFSIDGTEYLTSWDGDVADDCGESESMNIKIHKILGPGMVFKYEYDFGTTTELRLKIVDSIFWGNERGEISMVGMNNKPDAVCSECGKPAIYHYAEWDNEKVLCKTCASDDELDECYLLPICNSPRTGVCGYEGGKYDADPSDYEIQDDEEE